MVALRLNVRVDDLIVEKLRALRIPGNAPVVVVQKAAEEPELASPVQNLYRDEVAQLPHEGLDTLFESGAVTFDLASQQSLHATACKLGPEFFEGVSGILGQPGKGWTDTSLR